MRGRRTDRCGLWKKLCDHGDGVKARVKLSICHLCVVDCRNRCRLHGWGIRPLCPVSTVPTLDTCCITSCFLAQRLSHDRESLQSCNTKTTSFAIMCISTTTYSVLPFSTGALADTLRKAKSRNSRQADGDILPAGAGRPSFSPPLPLLQNIVGANTDLALSDLR